jgi:hypothetical protein
MQRYKDWAPGPGDIKGKGLHHLDNPYMFNEWLVAPLVKTRDCGLLSQSNWDYVIKLLEGPEDKDYDDYEVMSWNHWACGWFDMIVVKQGTRAHVLMNKVESSLEDYPSLDEEDWMKRESDAHHDEVYEHCDSLIRGLFHNELDERLLATYAETHIDNIEDWSLNDKFDPLAIASALNWYYLESYPDDEEVFDQLLEHGFIKVVLKRGHDD